MGHFDHEHDVNGHEHTHEHTHEHVHQHTHSHSHTHGEAVSGEQAVALLLSLIHIWE